MMFLRPVIVIPFNRFLSLVTVIHRVVLIKYQFRFSSLSFPNRAVIRNAALESFRDRSRRFDAVV